MRSTLVTTRKGRQTTIHKTSYGGRSLASPSAQDDLVKPRTSSTLDIGKFPSIPPNKGSWYSVVNAKYSQTPQVVPQAFSNIAKPGYRSGRPATVQQKDPVKLEYLSWENISTANFLSTFVMASKSCLNSL